MLMPSSANDLVEEGSVDKRHGASCVEEITHKVCLGKSNAETSSEVENLNPIKNFANFGRVTANATA